MSRTTSRHPWACAHLLTVLLTGAWSSTVWAWSSPPVLQPSSKDADGARQQIHYASVVHKVAAMPENEQATQMVSQTGLEILNVLWEDTGRWEGSSLGPNISDVTIEVQTEEGGHTRTALMPVIRYANFADKTGDVSMDKLMLPVGNQTHDGTLSYISLRDFLAEPTRYLSLPNVGAIKRGTLLAKRDRHALVSAQATFLPIPLQGKASFWPVIFNYQSTRKNPAVLTLLVTRQGTSATIVDNVRDTVGLSSWGQRLFFNKDGQRTPLTAERLSDVKASGTTMNGEAADSLGADANLLMIIQIPLKFRAPPLRANDVVLDGPFKKSMEGLAAAAIESDSKGGAAHTVARDKSDVEAAVLGHGPALGPYTELDGLTIERDPRFPVRVTVQFYQATSNGVLAANDIKNLRQQIKKVYATADYVGSLVMPSAADRARPTNSSGTNPRPTSISVQDFPGLMQRRHDQGADSLGPLPPSLPRGVGPE